jgi:tetratricopeptide (TPR) repeat protein
MAMIALAASIGVALASVRKRPLLAFAALFFLINHAVESSFLPIEMVFEHRNYLPSAFVFWPLVAVGIQLQARLAERQSSFARALPFLAVGLVLIFLLGTYTRNMDWRNARSLWADTFRKAPQSARAAVNLGNDLARAGQYDQAEYLYREALDLYSPRRNQFKVVARSNLAAMYLNMGQPGKALDEWGRVLEIVPHNRPARLGLAKLYLAMGQYDQAEAMIDWLLKRHPREASFLSIKASLLIRQNRAEDALVIWRRVLAQKPGHGDTLVGIGVAMAVLGYHERADWFFRRALKTSSHHDLGIQLVRLENGLEAGHTRFSNALTARILGRFPIETLWARLDDPAGAVRQTVTLRRVFTRHLEEKARQLENIGRAP